MRFTIFHCHNPACSYRLWVPITKLGAHGKCPRCAQPMDIPVDVPMDQFFEGPEIFQEDESRPLACGSTS